MTQRRSWNERFKAWKWSKLLWGLAGVFVFLLLSFGWMVYENNRTEEIIKDLQVRGMNVHISERSPEWLIQLGGPIDSAVRKYVSFRKVTQISTAYELEPEHHHFTSEDIRNLKRMPELDHLTLYHNGISDNDLSDIGKLSKLTVLRLNCSHVTDSGISYLGKLEHLKSLVIERSPKLTAKGFSQLTNLPQLDRLEMVDVSVTDEGLAQISQMEKLEGLAINGSLLTKKGIQQLERAKNLKTVAIYNPSLSEEEMEELVRKPIGGRVQLAFYRKDPVTKNTTSLKVWWKDHH